uniref:Uncharacterized protein n=1 Tax=viral metagenome TaxID=1070528 RepID=A0A6C0BRC1_9ZZZZ
MSLIICIGRVLIKDKDKNQWVVATDVVVMWA